MWQTNFCPENYWKKLDKNKQTKLKIQRDLPLRQWVFGELRSKEKKKAKRCESSVWLHSPLKAMTILKAVAKSLRRKKNFFHSPVGMGEGSKNGVYIHPGGQVLEISKGFYWVPCISTQDYRWTRNQQSLIRKHLI